MIAAMNKYTKVSYETPVWNTQSSNNEQQIIKNPIKIKNNHQISILDRIRASKNIDLEDIDISNKIFKSSINTNFEADNFAVKIRNNQRPYEKSNNTNTKLNIGSFTPIYSNKNNLQQKSLTALKEQKQKENVTYTPARSKIPNPKHSLTEKIVSLKSSRQNLNQSSRIPRAPLTQISVHQHLYLDSRKKQIKRSTQLMIQNQYFKKKHPFKPQIGQVSQFLAEQRNQKLKQRQLFQKQFQHFEDWKQNRKLNHSTASRSTKRVAKDSYDLKNQKQNNQKQAELKNYTILRQFFYYLSGSQEKLCFIHFTSKKLCQLPSSIIKLLQPIIQTFYKNKQKYILTWLQFLSEFNLKINKRKAFYVLIEKWFQVKFDVTFQGAAMHQKRKIQKNDFTKDEDSTNLGHSLLYEESVRHNQSSKRK